jgi:hypothetical protein
MALADFTRWAPLQGRRTMEVKRGGTMKALMCALVLTVVAGGLAYGQQPSNTTPGTVPGAPVTPTTGNPFNAPLYPGGPTPTTPWNPYSSFGSPAGVLSPTGTTNPYSPFVGGLLGSGMFTTPTPFGVGTSPVGAGTVPSAFSMPGTIGQGAPSVSSGGGQPLATSSVGFMNPFLLFGTPTSLNPFTLFGNPYIAPTPSTVTMPSLVTTPVQAPIRSPFTPTPVQTP